MAYNTKAVIKDVDGNPISQYFNPLTDEYESVEGAYGGNKVVVYNSDGTESNVSLIPILDKLSQLTGTVIDEETRKSNETQRVVDEDIRKSNEVDRIGNESTREVDESTRKTQESGRVSAESSRVTVESGRVTAESTRVSNEDIRKSNEIARESSEVTRITNEDDRKSNESSRQSSETIRNTNEDVRIDNEDIRKSNEVDRVSSELAREVDEGVRESQELGRVNAESDRASAESIRVSSENTRKSNEDTRQSQEITRESNEDLRIALYDDLSSKVASGFFKGDKGDTGEQGPQGIQGEVGPQGPKGDKGDKGDDGYTPVIANSLTETVTGKALDATQGKVLKDLVDKHLVEKSTKNKLGHVKIDNKTIGLNGDGEIEVRGYEPPPLLYGIEIDEANSNPETAVTYTDDAVGFIPASGNNGAFNWGSWESIIKDEFKIRPCVLNNPAKTVNYYLDYDNYTLKATGGASNLTGVDGDVMIEFGTDIYTKWTTLGSKHKIQFSVEPFEGATKNAFETENEYNQFVYYPLLLTQKLYLLVFKNRHSQTALGRGYVDGNRVYATTGNTNTKGFMFGETTGKQQMKFLGIEDYWGNKYQCIDGLVTDASYNLLIGNSGFNDSGSGYTSYASGVSANTPGYIDTVQGGNNKGFIIKGKSGSETTHYCDYGRLNSGRVARFGGYLSDGSSAGFTQLQLGYVASTANEAHCGRLMCVNNGKLYIGAYLGTTQGGKLRSVSGTTPSDNKTISVFRSEAKANNV